MRSISSIAIFSILFTSAVANAQSTSASGTVTISGTELSKQVVANPATPGEGSVTISGSEGSFESCVTVSGKKECRTLPDSGKVTVTVNGVTNSASYGSGSTAASVASALSNAINANSNQPVTASISGSMVFLKAKQTGPGTNFSLSTSITLSGGPRCIFGTASSSTLTGGANATFTTSYDTGTVTVTVNGYPKSTTYGQGSTSSGIVSALVSVINGDSNEAVNASAPSGSSTLTLTTKAVGWNVNFSLSSSAATTNSNFSTSSYSTSNSSATLTGGTSVPNIASLSASNGTEGSSVTVNGMGFATTQGTSTVALSGTGCTIASWSDTAIQIAIPSPAFTGNVVATVNGTNSNGVVFTVAPTITSLSVSSGAVSVPVSASGRNFGSSPGSVTFGNNNIESQQPAAATPTSWASNSVATSVPAGALTGTVVITANGMSSNGLQFTVAPQITSISPNPVGSNMNVAINGTNFNATQGSGTISFNSANQQPVIWGDTGIAVIVPSSFAPSTGTQPVTVTITQNGMTAQSSLNVISAPTISGLSASSNLAPGTNITISGTNFGTSGNVYFNWTPASTLVWGTSIQAAVPAGATGGQLYVRNTGGTSNGVPFTISSPPPTTSTLANETTNNTSASTSFGGFADYRTTDPNATDPAGTISPKTVGQAIVSTPFDVVMNNSSSPVNVATGRFVSGTMTVAPTNIRTLAYPGFSGKILGETQEWFCTQDNATPFKIDYNPGFLGGTDSNTHTFKECGGHLDVGYDSDDTINIPSHGQMQIDNMYQRGFDGFIADTAGYGFDCLASTAAFVPGDQFNQQCSSAVGAIDDAIMRLAQHVNTSYPVTGTTNQPMYYMLMEDQQAFEHQCWSPDQYQPLCIALKIEADISAYSIHDNYFGPNYLKSTDGVTPLLAFFVDTEQPAMIDPSKCSFGQPCLDMSFCNTNQCTVQSPSGGTTSCSGTFTDSAGGTVSNCWIAIWNAVKGASSPSVAMIFRNSGGFSTTEVPPTSGSFAWVNTNAATGLSITLCTQNDWLDYPNNPVTGCPDQTKSNYIDGFYAAGKAAKSGVSPMIVMGIAKKGFDKEDAPFGATLTDNATDFNHPSTATTSQQCGQVWLNSFAEPNVSKSFGGPGTGLPQLDYMIVGTWDDYEEGTEVETGIDNCLALSASMAGSIFNWSPGFTDVSGSEKTINHYDLFSADSSGNLTALYSESPINGLFSTHALDLNTQNIRPFGESLLTMYLKAAGQPSILNHLTPKVTYQLGHGNAYVIVTPGGSADIPSDTGSVGVNVFSGGTQICAAKAGFLAHRPLDDSRNVANHLAQAINADPTCSTSLSATSNDDGVVYMTAKALGSGTNYTFVSVSTGLSFITTDSYGGRFLGGQ